MNSSAMHASTRHLSFLASTTRSSGASSRQRGTSALQLQGRPGKPSVRTATTASSSFPASEALSLSLSGAPARILPSSAAARGQIVVTLSSVVDVVIHREWNIESVFGGRLHFGRKERELMALDLALACFCSCSPWLLNRAKCYPFWRKKKSVQSAKARRGLKKSRDVLRSAPDVFVLQVVPLGEDY